MPAFVRRVNDVPGVPAAAFLAGLVLLFEPAQIYQANEAFFPQYNLAQLSFVLVPAFLAVFAILAVVASVGGPRARQAIAVIYSGIALAAWAGGTFFVASTGLLDGQALLRLADKSAVYANAALLAAIFLAGCAIARYLPLVARRFFTVFLVVLAAQYLWIAASEEKPWRLAADPERLSAVSKERNVLVILLDAFQSDFFMDILAREPGLTRDLDGFTYFAEAVGPSPTTYLAMPVIHAGVRLREQDNLPTLYDSAIVRDSFVARHAAAGYDAVFVNPVFGRCPMGARCDNADQLAHGRVVVALDSASFLLNLSLFRVLPHAFKPAIYRNGEWWLPWKLETRKQETSNQVLDMMARDLRASAARPTLRFLHLFNSHAPVRLDANCRIIEGTAWARESAIAQDRCALRHVFDLLDAYRRLDLYDRTAVVVLADHGTGLAPDGPFGFALGHRASPLLLVKPFGSRGPVVTSHRVVGLGDLPATICSMTDACSVDMGSNILAAAEGRAPSYPYVSYVWTNQFGADSLAFDNRFEVRGPPREIASWWRLTNLPKTRATRLEFAKSDTAGSYGFGWSEFEVHGGRTLRWATGSESDIYLELDASRDARLGLVVSTHGENPGQVMSIEVNGAKAGDFPVGFAPSLHEITVPARMLREGANRVLFRFLKSKAPGADTRQLAVLFDSLTVNQAGK
jgi:hypothetical protein